MPSPLTYDRHLGCLIRTDPRDKHAWEYASPAEEARHCRHVIRTARARIPAEIADHRFFLREARQQREEGYPRGAAEALDSARWCRIKAISHRLDLQRATARLAVLEPGEAESLRRVA